MSSTTAASTPTPDLAAALRELDTLQQQNPPDRERRFARFAVQGEARLWPGGGDRKGAATTVFLRDISRGGVGVLSVLPVRLGQVLHIQLGRPDLPVATYPVFCRYCRRVTPTVYLIGLEFGIEAGTLLALGVRSGELELGSHSEQRLVEEGEFLSPEDLLGDAA
jgi:hypothetical protein